MPESTSNLKVTLLKITQEFLLELNKERALSVLKLTASLDKDLGIDSLGRVELFLRIEKATGIAFSESQMAEVDTLQDIVNAIAQAPPGRASQPHDYSESLEASQFDTSHLETLTEVLLHRAHTEPDRPHIYYQEADGREIPITYGKLLEKATEVAKGLVANGIKLGDTIAIMLPTCPEFFYSFMGVLLVGAIPVPIYPPFRPDRIEEYAMREAKILQKAEVRMLITFYRAETLSKLLKVFIPSLLLVITVENLVRKEGKLPTIPLSAEQGALIQFTSGSTSDPKGVYLKHKNLLANIRCAGKTMAIGPTDVGISWLPLYHDMGLIGAWFAPLILAIPVTIMSPLSFLARPERWLWTLHYHRGTLSAAPNFAYELCIQKIDERKLEGLDLSSWRLALNGAEAVNPKTIERFTEKFKVYGFKPEAFYPVYGLAESSVALLCPPLNRVPQIDSIEKEPFEQAQRAEPIHQGHRNGFQFVSCGKPIVDHQVRIVNDNNQAVEERQIGRLQFKGPSTMAGYYNSPEATQRTFVDGWCDTGDLAYQAEGEIYITGRKKDVIIKSGRNLHPEEVEEVTMQVEGVRKGCVVAFGALDRKAGTEKLVVVAEVKPKDKKTRNVIEQNIIEKVTTGVGLPPDEVILVDPHTIPKTSSGKLQRSACKHSYLVGKLCGAKWPMWVQLGKLFTKSLFLKSWYWAKWLARVAYTLYVWFITAVTLLPVWGVVAVAPKPIGTRLTKGWSRWIFRFIGIPITVLGLNKLRQFGPVVYVANHACYLDSILLLGLLPPGTVFVGKKELLAWPIVSTFMNKLEFLTVDRVDFLNNLEDTEKISRTLAKHRSIAIYPEGTFAYAAGLRPFKLGAFKVSAQHHIPIRPIVLKGTRSLLRAHDWLLKPGRITVTIGDRIVPKSNDWHEVTRLHALARAVIAKDCGEQVLDL